MKNRLPIKPLQLLCDDFKQDIVDGPFGSELQRKDYITKGVPVLKIQNVKPFAIELKKMDYVSPAKFQELRRHSYRRGDIVMTKLGSPLGVSAIVENLDEGVIVADLVRIRAQRINTKYLCYHLNSQQTNDFINSMQKGTTRPRVTLSVVRELPIFVPSPAEQQRIVGLLDEAFAGLATAKANAEKNLQNARALFASHLQSVFTQRGKGWVEKPLGELATFRNGINYTKDSKGERIKIVGVRNFQKHFSAPLDDLDTVTIDGKLSELDSLKQDDILAVRSNGNIDLIGRCILVGEVTGKISHSGFTIRIRLSNGIVLPKYVCHFMKSARSKKLLTEGGTGTNIKSLNQGMLSALAIPFPPFAAQKVLVDQLESLSEETQRLASLYERKLAALEALKKSLLHKAFNGEL